MASNSREARRRKIIERGSDRLRFITSQTRSIPDPPPSDSLSPSESQLRSYESLSDSSPPPGQILSGGISASTSYQENSSDAALPKKGDVDKRDLYQSIAEQLQSQMSAETLTDAPASEPRDTIQLSPTTSTTQRPPVADLSAHQALFPLRHLSNAITPKHIGAAIDASENERMFSSLTIALLGILSGLGFSSLGNIISFRPVFLLLLTDATIVLGRVLLSHRSDFSTASRGENTGRINEQGIADQIGYALDMAMMMKKIMNAVLMDFSLYAVILICGLLLSQGNLA